MHDMFRRTFGDKPKTEVNEETGEINLSGGTKPMSQDIWLDNK